ncbi:MAG: TadE/TadG family type IV pilus assembly protein [Candidatus Cybelea sp.]
MKPKHGERGASLVETVIVMGVLLALMFGIIDFGRALYTYSFVAQLARQGARWAIVRGANCTVLCPSGPAGPSDVQTYVQSLSEGATDPTQITVTAVWSGTGCTASHTPGCLVTVNVSYPFRFFLPFVLPGHSITMSSSSQMVVSN